MILGDFISLKAFTVYKKKSLPFEIWTEVSFTPPEAMWTLIIKLPHTEVKFYPEVNSNRFEISLCNRVLLLFGKLPQWNHHVNCHVNGTTFQTGLRFQTGLSSLRVSCKRTLNEIYIVSKAVLYFNADADAVKAEMSMLRFPRGLLHADELKFSLGRNFILIWNTSTRIKNRNLSTGAELKNTICSIFIRHDI